MAATSELPRIVLPTSMGPMTRLYGSLGIDGEGTACELDSVDPFLMCDYVCMPINVEEPPFRPPFCAHPHAGNAVASVLMEGEDMTAWDNIQGSEKEKLRAGGVYVVCAGPGCVHDEGPDSVVIERTIRRTPFGFAGSEAPGGRFRFFQIWFDPGHVHAEDGPPPVCSQVVQPDQVPMMLGGAMKIRVLVGRYEGVMGVEMPATILHCALEPFSKQGVLKIPAGANGFLFCMERGASVSIADATFSVPPKAQLVLPPCPEGYELQVAVLVDEAGTAEDAKADVPLEMLVGFGPRVGKPFYKLLGYGGALVASSEEKVRRLMREYEQDPKNFGVPSGKEPADASRYGLQVGYKDPLDGKGECQREDPEAPAPEARFYLLEKGPYQPKGKGKGKAAK